MSQGALTGGPGSLWGLRQGEQLGVNTAFEFGQVGGLVVRLNQRPRAQQPEKGNLFNAVVKL